MHMLSHQELRRAACVIAVGALLAAGGVWAQSIDQAPVCAAKTVTMKSYAAVLQFDPIAAAPACSDADGDRLRLTAVSSPATLIYDEDGRATNSIAVANLSDGGTVTIIYTVSDGRGETTEASLIINRQAVGN